MTDESRHASDLSGSGEAAKAVELALVPKGTDYAEINNELASQTERGAAILGGAYIEWRVRQAIKHRMIKWDITPPGKLKSESVGGLVFGDDEDGSVGKLGFADQCRVAYCMGLIGPLSYLDLKEIAKIRNRFAHHVEVNSFENDGEVRDRCMSLKTPAKFSENIFELTKNTVDLPFGKAGPRAMYLDSIHLIWIAVYNIATLRLDSVPAVQKIYFW